jgi:putative ABC transport system permease protein
MGVLKYKILRDLWGQKGRTLQVMLIIGIGAAAIGMIMSTRNLVIAGMQSIWHTMNPAMINLYVSPTVNQDELYALKNVDGVSAIEGLSSTTIEWRLKPSDDWKPGGLSFRADYPHQELNKYELVEGDWPTDEIVAMGQDNGPSFGIPAEGQIELRVNDKIFKVHTRGAIYNQLVQPAYFGGNAQFYVTQDFYDKLTGDRDFNQILVNAPQYDESAVKSLADRLQDKLKKQNIDSGRQLLDPNKHFFQDQMDGVFLLLTILGFLSLALGLLLVYNTINALISQQVDQIGIMKAIGASTGQVLKLYLLNILIYGFLSLVISLPVGIFGGWAITSWLIGSFGADPGAFQISASAILVQTAIAFLAPLLAALLPIYSAVRITVREAISTYGLSTKVGLIEKLLAKARNLSRLLLITISNTFRHKRRVILLQIALVLSGLMFMSVIAVRDSVNYTVRDVIFAILNADITMVFDRPQRITHIEDLTMQYPGIKAVEMWGFAAPKIRPMGQPASEDDEDAFMLGVPLPTRLYGYQIRAGRWLNPDDSYAIVLNQKLAKDVGVGVGDWVTIKYEEKKERDFQVVGLVFDPVLTTSANVPREILLHDLDNVGRASSVWIQVQNQDPKTQVTLAENLRNYYDDNHIKVSPQRGVFGMGDSTYETATKIIGQFDFLVILLAIMSVIIGAVGSIALSGALSLSVMERRREIGVMRAIGASSWTIARLFIGEGLILGWLSWLIAFPLSLPAGQGMVKALGAAFQIDLTYNYTPVGAILWLVIITFLSILASWLPARGASGISVRESLAYQ